MFVCSWESSLSGLSEVEMVRIVGIFLASCLIFLAAACDPSPDSACEKFGEQLGLYNETKNLGPKTQAKAIDECVALLTDIKEYGGPAYHCVTSCMQSAKNARKLLGCPKSCEPQADDKSVIRPLSSGDSFVDSRLLTR